jgi:phage shock protein A
MEPITWAVLLTLAAEKATEKIVDQIGEGAIASAKHLLEVLRRRSPETVLRLEAAGEASDTNVIDVEIVEEVMRVAAAEPEVQTAVDATVAAVAAEPGSLQSLTKLADKIGVIQMGRGDNIAGDKVAGDKIGTQINHITNH